MHECTRNAVRRPTLDKELKIRYRVSMKSNHPPSATFVDISAIRANFCMKFFYTAVKQQNVIAQICAHC